MMHDANRADDFIWSQANLKQLQPCQLVLGLHFCRCHAAHNMGIQGNTQA